jgi:hypothetical protein
LLFCDALSTAEVTVSPLPTHSITLLDCASLHIVLPLNPFMQVQSYLILPASLGPGIYSASNKNGYKKKKQKQTPWPESASELYRPSDRRLLAKLVPAFADKGCHVVSVTDPHDRILGFLGREMSTRNIKILMFLESKVRPVRRADNLTAIYEPIVQTMWDP